MIASRLPVWFWFRAWCALMVAVYLGIALAGVGVGVWCIQQPNMGVPAALFAGGAPVFAGLIGGAAFAWVGTRKIGPRTWTIGLVALIVGCIGSCPPLAVPLLVVWLRDDTRIGFGRPPRVG